MNRRTQNRDCISRVRGRAAAVLALAIMLALTTGCPLFGGGSSSSSSSGGSGSGSGQAYTESVLYSFTGAPDGANPYSAGLIQDAQRNLYGATAAGGDASCNGSVGTGCGTVFKLDSAGNETVLHTFTGSPDGEVPYAGLVLDAQGNLYGTTTRGGVQNAGTVFEVDATGNETILYSFCAAGSGNCTDGTDPEGGVVLDAQGNLYGTSSGGGASNNGTVFKLSAAGEETVLYSFTGAGGDGAFPMAGLAMDTQGNLYGTTYGGGDPTCGLQGWKGCGIVFKVDTSGNETVLYTFTGNAVLFAGVVLDSQGNLYGATGAGGSPATGCGGSGCGTVFKIDASGNESVLSNLGTENGGWGPYGTLVLDSQGNVYGTTFGGASEGGGSDNCQNGCGTVFEIDTSGNYTVLYNFKGGSDGQQPDAALLLDSQDNLYGTTRGGGSGNGTVFKLTP